jgi:hypothetical protein
LVLLFFLTAREYAPRFASPGTLTASLAPWIVLTAFFAFGAWRLARVPR